MFETIAMICYLSMVEPQELKLPNLELDKKILLENFGGGAGQDPEDNPKKTGDN